MKTEQEQIEKMARTMCGYCSTDGKCAVSKNGREPDICANVDTQHCLYKEYAERLIDSNYGKVSEYKAEIEQLKDNHAKLQELFANYQLASDKELKAQVKQAKIDILNFLKDGYEDDISTSNDCDMVVRVDDIDELIKEVEEQ